MEVHAAFDFHTQGEAHQLDKVEKTTRFKGRETFERTSFNLAAGSLNKKPLGQLDLRKKNWRAGNALLSLREKLDLDEAPRLSGYDRERVCVPKACDCGQENCRYS